MIQDEDADDEGQENIRKTEPEEDDPYANFWNENFCIGDCVIMVRCENISNENIEVEVKVSEHMNNTIPMNCQVPVTPFLTQIFSSGVSTKPCAALITKIDPTKPFGMFDIDIGVRRPRRAGAGNRDYSAMVN